MSVSSVASNFSCELPSLGRQLLPSCDKSSFVLTIYFIHLHIPLSSLIQPLLLMLIATFLVEMYPFVFQLISNIQLPIIENVTNKCIQTIKKMTKHKSSLIRRTICSRSYNMEQECKNDMEPSD